MLVEVAHRYGPNWVFYVIAPVILSGVVACLWWIVKGAIGVIGQTPRRPTSKVVMRHFDTGS